MCEKSIYFIPGRGEKLTGEIGQIIAEMGFSGQGRAVIGDFERLSFSEQLTLIRADLQSGFWHPKGILIGHSFGAYLLLHALAEMESFGGKVLLLSPVLGAGISKDALFGSIPPRVKNFSNLRKATIFQLRAIWKFTPEPKIMAVIRCWQRDFHR